MQHDADESGRPPRGLPKRPFPQCYQIPLFFGKEMEFALRPSASASSLYLDDTCVWKHVTLSSSSTMSMRDAVLHLVCVATSSATSLDGTPAFDATQGFGTCVASSIVALLHRKVRVQVLTDVVVTHPGIHAQTTTSFVLHVARPWDLYASLFVPGRRGPEAGTAADVVVAHEALTSAPDGFALCIAWTPDTVVPTVAVACPALPWVWVVRSQGFAVRIADTVTASDECPRILTYHCGVRTDDDDETLPDALCSDDLKGRCIHVDVVWDRRPDDTVSFPTFALAEVEAFASVFMVPRHALAWSRSALVCALFQAVQDPLHERWRVTEHDGAPTSLSASPLLPMLRDSRVHGSLLRHVDAAAVLSTCLSSSRHMDAMAKDVFRRFEDDASCVALRDSLSGVRTVPFPCQRLTTLMDLGCFSATPDPCSRCRLCHPHGLLLAFDHNDDAPSTSSSSPRRGWWLVVGMNASHATLFAALGGFAHAHSAPPVPLSPSPSSTNEETCKVVHVDSEIVLTWGTAWYERDPVVVDHQSLCRQAPYRLRLDVKRGGLVLQRVESERTTVPYFVRPIDALSRIMDSTRVSSPPPSSPLRLAIDAKRRRREDLVRAFPQLTRRLRLARSSSSSEGADDDDVQTSAIVRELQARRVATSSSGPACWTLEDMDEGRNLGSLGLSVLLGLLLSGWMGARVRVFVGPGGGAVVGVVFVSGNGDQGEEEEMQVFDPTCTSCNAFDLLPRMSDLPESGYDLELKRGIFVEVWVIKFWHVAHVTGVQATTGMMSLELVETGKTMMLPVRSVLWRRLARGDNTHVDRTIRSLLTYRPHEPTANDPRKRPRVQETA